MGFMDALPATAQIQALIRFGLGPRGMEAPPAEPRAWLASQLATPDPGAHLPTHSGAAGLRAIRAFRQSLQRARRTGMKPAQPFKPITTIFLADAGVLLGHQATTPAPFRERLVSFWTNHFTVSNKLPICAALDVSFVQEAIRPHVTGRFRDMLLAVMRHPAMLLYLNNAQSVGPDSPAGRRSHRGLNENLARECLELHTVSPAAGYTQADVTSFARILTGWSIDLTRATPGFVFRRFAHAPGAQMLMGHRFPPGEAGGEQALAFLADHPATHHHLATQMVRHFVADTPPPEAIAAITAVLRDTGGDLGAAARALIDQPGAWTPMTKLRSPADYIVATARLLGMPAAKGRTLLPAMRMLGEPFFTAPLPNGWPDTAADWGAPEAMMRRIDFAYLAAGRAGPAHDPAALASAALGQLLPEPTLTAIARAGSRREALTLLLAAAEFQRR